MWRLSGVRPEERGTDGSGWLVGDPIDAEWLDGEPVDRDRVSQLLRQTGMAESEGISRTLVADSERDMDPGLQAIESWAGQAAEESSGDIHLAGVANGMPFALASESPEGPTVVWHDMSILAAQIPPGYAFLRLEYERDQRDVERGFLLEERFRRARKRDFVDWRFYIGTRTPAVNGESPARRVTSTRWRAGVRLGGIGGILIARFANWRGPAQRVPRDPSWTSRVKQSESEYPDAADAFPLVEGLAADANRALVYVHGTMSCALPALDAVHDIIGRNVARFEHDTFISIRHNAADLARQIIDRRLAPRDLHFVGHSRGGLVARLAAAQVFRHARPAPDRISVHTFGTPHRGTPLVGQALIDLEPVLRMAQLFSGLLSDAQHRRWRDLGSTAWSYLLRGRQMPEGVLEMAPGDLLLEMIEIACPPQVPTIACGGNCEITIAPDGTKISFFQSLGKEIFTGPNDLIVSRDSATAVGTAWRLADPCTHFDYFINDEVRQALAGLA
jgi:hypothetical protein